jgi:predicted RNA-binding protein
MERGSPGSAPGTFLLHRRPRLRGALLFQVPIDLQDAFELLTVIDGAAQHLLHPALSVRRPLLAKQIPEVDQGRCFAIEVLRLGLCIGRVFIIHDLF